MHHEPLRTVIARLRRLNKRTVAGGLSDAQLLDRFCADGDEAAFEVLLWRHGPMVLGVCRRVLAQEQDAEDAFQSTFLALARKAGSIGNRQALVGWLYQVAYRVALTARAMAAHRATRERPWLDLPAKETPDDLLRRDFRRVLDEEVSRLPAKYRLPFVLCHLEGKTNEEVARELGCPTGTVLSRLARARERLRVCLTRRGVTLSAGALALALAREAEAVSVSASQVQTSLHAAAGVALGRTAAEAVGGRVLTLTEGVLRTMYLSKVKAMVGVFFAVGVLGLGTAALGGWLAGSGDEPQSGVNKPPAGVSGLGAEAAPAAEPEDEARLAGRRARSINNLKQIGLALHNYHDTYTHFPAPALYDKSGKPLLSWRVMLLPYFEQDQLYKRFKLDEPWDSPNNKALVAEIPGVYSTAEGDAAREKGLTHYQAVVGQGAAFERQKTLRLPDFTDGLSNTILVVEAGTPVPWTKPEDLPFVPDQALPRFGGLFKGDFNALLGDGSVRFLSGKADAAELRKALTRAGGEVLDFGKLPSPASANANQPEAHRLAFENAGLKLALVTTGQEVAKLKQELQALHEQLGRRAAAGDEATAKLTKENQEMLGRLTQMLQERDKLREERLRLQKELQKMQPGRR